MANKTVWRKGTSGNPAGRPRGTGQVAQLREEIAQHLPAIIQRLTALALEGDTPQSRPPATGTRHTRAKTS